MAYLSNSEADIREMLEVIGFENVEELLSNIPQDLRFKGTFNIPEAESELGISRIVQQLAEKNKTYVSFLGGGAYDHYIPSIIDALTSRSEFYTSYTPYQPEVSQGNLQAMYEFQSMICELTEMDITNASMYEAGSALAEAVLVAAGHTGKNKILIPATLNSRYKQIIETYINNTEIELTVIPDKDLTIDHTALKSLIDDQIAAVIVQHPNYFGFFEDVAAIKNAAAGKDCLIIQVYDPTSLGLLKTPGAFGVDIAVAEGQSLGNGQNYGGPFLGLFSVNESLVRKIPGRLSGVTKDEDGKRGFVLTLQTREQHIRREKATSNICTNSGLMALTAGIYMSTLGKKGIKDVAGLCLQKAHYLAKELTAIPGISMASKSPFFKEFTLSLPVKAEDVIKAALKEGIFAGIDLKKSGHANKILIAVTEQRTREELDKYIQFYKKYLK
ncbi:MAG: aminomethyl-transferring glycine dehydrogenase subunit GcvPA [Calditrichaceae bacterium]